MDIVDIFTYAEFVELIFKNYGWTITVVSRLIYWHIICIVYLQL